MATEEELDLDTKPEKSGGKGKVIAIIAIVALLLTGSTIGVLYFTGMLDGGGNTSAEQNQSDTSETKENAEVGEVKPAFYFDLSPPFIINFENKSYAAYLQIEMQLMMRDERVKEQINIHMPVIRNNILLILSAQKFEEVKGRPGKEQLQAKVLEAVREVIGTEMKKALQKESETEIKAEDVPNVEQVYFTSFIMQ